MKSLLLILAAGHLLIAQTPGVVEGILINKLTREGIPGVDLSLIAIYFGGQPYQVKTDARGQFHCELPEGQYRLIVDAREFMPLVNGDPSQKPFHVTAGGDPVRMRIELTPWATLRGSAVDSAGRPAGGVTVEMRRTRGGDAHSARTDPGGHFSIQGLGSGTYLLLVNPLPPGASVAGQKQSSPMAPPPQGEGWTWAPTYYPDGVERAAAQPITVRAGQELTGYDVTVRPMPFRKVRGVVLDDLGQPAGGIDVQLSSEESASGPEQHISSAADGSFEFPQVRIGNWQLLAEFRQANTYWNGLAGVTVVGRDVDGVRIRLTPPFTMEGFVERDDQRDWTGKRQVTSVALLPAGSSSAAASASHEQDGKLYIPGVHAGRYRIAPASSVPGFYVASVRLGNREVMGQVVDLSPASPPIRVVYKANGARVRGVVDKGDTATVALIPQDPALLNAQFIHSTVCDASGQYQMDSLRPGDYYALAFDRMDAAALVDPVFLRAVISRAERVHVEPGETAVVSLKMLPWPE